MLSPRPNRGQTEPIAALIAVSAFAVGIGIYGAYVTDTIPGTSERTPEQTAIDLVWTDLEDAGVYLAHEHPRNVSSEIGPDAVPNGKYSHVAVEVYTDGTPETVAEARFDDKGRSLSLEDVDDPPNSAGVASRRVPVTIGSKADVRSGTLTVEVWS
ncbi:DUF7285 family protein [Halostagnicola kamekurae]|uniref:Uncharacterized protein n=1 Tax=Halostagnicola kamekurae TaxID=619731 RepID=A0A1I6RNF5_9EURY|nr:hypothetical protein [Halostagnicola kamekurae]SFS66239.1 hypothetical protein SAMN04488556_1938 [Halostagnicola kamekurae]